MTNPTRVAIDQNVNLPRVLRLHRDGVIEVSQVHDLEQIWTSRGVAGHGHAFTLDHSTLDGPDRLADERWEQTLKIVGAGNRTDAEHLYAAYLNGIEYFLTEDGDEFIDNGRREQLEALLVVKIRRLQEFFTETGLRG